MPTENTVVTIVEPQAAVKPGEHTGEIVDQFENHYDADSGWAEVDDPDNAGDPVSYWGVEVELDGADDFTLRESWSLNSGRIHENTGLGAVLQSMGYDLQTMRDEDLTLEDILAIGKTVQFDVVEEEYEDDEGETQTSLNLENIRPVGEDAESAGETGSGGGSEDDESDAKSEVLGIVGGQGYEKQEAIREVAQENGALVPVFNTMLDNGELNEENGEIVIA